MIKRFMKNKFLKDNAILFIANGVGAAFTFMFHFYTGRVLGPEGYGTIGAILSIIYILIVLIYTLQTTVTKFVADLKVKEENEKISYMLRNLFRSLLVIGGVGTLIMLLFSGPISSYLKLGSTTYVQVTAFVFAFILLLPLARGALQGHQRFTQLGWTYVLEGLGKLIAAILLVEIGFGVLGAVIAIVLSYIIPTLYAMRPFRKVSEGKRSNYPVTDVYKYSIPVLVGMLGLTLFYALDLILIKHFLSAYTAGEYTAISNIGKIVHFSSITIGLVLFPKLSEVLDDRKKRQSLLFKSLLLVTAISIPTVSLYYLFPDLIILTLYGSQYISIAPYLGKFGVFMGIISLCYVLVYYFLAKKHYFPLAGLFAFVGLEALLIYQHHTSIGEVINIVLFVTMALFVFLLANVVFEKESLQVVENG